MCRDVSSTHNPWHAVDIYCCVMCTNKVSSPMTPTSVSAVSTVTPSSAISVSIFPARTFLAVRGRRGVSTLRFSLDSITFNMRFSLILRPTPTVSLTAKQCDSLYTVKVWSWFLSILFTMQTHHSFTWHKYTAGKIAFNKLEMSKSMSI